MNQEDIIRMAREAGFPITNHLSGRQDIAGQSVARFRRFATLVAAAEREACAQIADTAEPYKCSDLIRARGNNGSKI